MRDFDQAIDRAVREMLDVEPRSGLRARVLERIAELRPRSPLRWAIVPIAAAALLMLILSAPWWTSQKAAPVIASTSLATVVPSVHASSPSAVSRPATMRAGAPREAKALRAEPNAPSMTVAVAPLEALDGINVPPVAVARLDAQQVTVAPLAPIEQIEIEPVGSPEGRN